MLSEESLSQKFIKKGFWLYAFTFLWAPLWYIIKITLSRDLSVHDLGLFYAIISIITLLSAINDVGLSEALNYFLPKYIIKNDYGRIRYLLWLAFKTQIFTSIIIIAILFLNANWLANNYFSDPNAELLIQIFSLFFLGTNLTQVCMAMFSASQNTKLQKAVDFFRMLATAIFTIMLFFGNINSIIYYSLAWIGGIIIAVILGWIWFFKYYYHPYLKNTKTLRDLALRKSIFRYAIPTFLTANISLILSQIDAQMIIWMLGNESHGYYSNYLSIMTLPFIVISPIIGFLFPVFSEMHSRNQLDTIKNIFRNFITVMSILSIWISIFMWQNGTLLAQILFWEKYHLSGIILQYSTPFLIFNILNQINFQLLAGTGQAWARTVSFGVALPINIILNWYCIQKWWVQWSALAVGISWIPMYIITCYYTRKYITLPQIFPIITNIIIAIIAWFWGYYISKLWYHPWILLAIIIAIYAILFIWINIKNAKKMLFTLLPHNSKNV